MNKGQDYATTLRRIFQEVAQPGETTTSTLAHTLGLNTSPLETYLRPLLRSGLLAYHHGRKKVGLNRDYGYVVGIDMGASHLHYALADFRGEILTDRTEKIRPEDGPRKMIAQIKEGIRRLVAEVTDRRERKAAARTIRRPPLRALAIGVPSPVDPERGVVAFANNLPGWKNIHLARKLEQEFSVPIFLENDANTAAIGEHWRGVARRVKNFVFIALGTGIGSGIFVDGRVHHGRTGNAGELYRLNVEWQRWEEDFGDVGYFEGFVSGMGIAAEGRRVLGPKAPSESANLALERDAYFVFEAYRQGSPQAREVLEKAFTRLGVGIANLVAVLDPDLIVLGGGVTRGAPELLMAIVDRVVHRIQPDPPPIKLSSLKDKAQTYGAIFSALTVAQEGWMRRLESRN